MSILIVFASQAIMQRDASAAWARGILRTAIRTEPRPRVYTGDADGPEGFAIACAGSDYTRWMLRGDFYCGMTEPHPEGWWIKPPHPPPALKTREDRRLRALARDRAMIEHAAMCAGRGDAVRVLALRAPWGDAHPVDVAVSRARDAGLDVQALTYPEVM